MTKEEFEILKRHCADGCEMVKGTYYAHIGEIIQQHHERIDGSGYPYGLQDNEILIEAQIIGIADTFDALTTDRVYRGAVSHLEAINEIKRGNNRHFSKSIVEAFERVLILDGVLPDIIQYKKVPK